MRKENFLKKNEWERERECLKVFRYFFLWLLNLLYLDAPWALDSIATQWLHSNFVTLERKIKLFWLFHEENEHKKRKYKVPKSFLLLPTILSLVSSFYTRIWTLRSLCNTQKSLQYSQNFLARVRALLEFTLTIHAAIARVKM